MAVRPTAIRNSCRRTSKQGWFRLPRRSRSMACSLSQALLGQSNNHKRKREDDMLKSVHRMLAVAAVSLAALAAGPSVAAEFITVGGGSTGGAFFTISAGMARVLAPNNPAVKATADRSSDVRGKR